MKSNKNEQILMNEINDDMEEIKEALYYLILFPWTMSLQSWPPLI